MCSFFSRSTLGGAIDKCITYFRSPEPISRCVSSSLAMTAKYGRTPAPRHDGLSTIASTCDTMFHCANITTGFQRQVRVTMLPTMVQRCYLCQSQEMTCFLFDAGFLPFKIRIEIWLWNLFENALIKKRNLYYKRRRLYLCSAKDPVLHGSGSRRVYRRKGTSFDRVYVCL